MARIVLSDQAPTEAIHFSLVNDEFILGGASDKKSYETDDRGVLAAAAEHPWLEVEQDEVKEAAVFAEDTRVAPEDDPLSDRHPNAALAFDAEAIAKFEAEKREGVSPVAINAGLDQDTPESTGPVAETIAADDNHEAAKSARAFGRAPAEDKE